MSDTAVFIAAGIYAAYLANFVAVVSIMGIATFLEIRFFPRTERAKIVPVLIVSIALIVVFAAVIPVVIANWIAADIHSSPATETERSS